MTEDQRRRLNDILKSMNVPEGRINDIFWLRRNLMFNNSEHEQFDEAMLLLRVLDR